MDMSLGLTSSERRNTKFQLPFPLLRNNSLDHSLPLHIQMESESPSPMFGTSGGCRITRLVLPNYNSTCNYMQKSTYFTKSGSSVQRDMVPKIPSITYSVSQQTIVGGFVGSKSHAGRSFFGDSSHIWDNIICRSVEYLSLTKEKPSEATKSKLTNSNSTSVRLPDITVHKNTHMVTPKESFDEHGSYSCSSVGNIDEVTNSVAQNGSHREPAECATVMSLPPESAVGSCKSVSLPTRRETYSSVVGGKGKISAQSGQCTMAIPKNNEQPLDGSKSSLLPTPKQSYADVAKTIPSKQLAPQSKTGCEVTQSVKNIWRSKIKRNCCLNKKVVNHQGGQYKNLSADNIMTNRDSRWRGDWKSKKAKFQKSRPVEMPAGVHSSSSSESFEENSKGESSSKVIKPSNVLEYTCDSEEIEPAHTECFKEGLRGRYPSECSLDSDDSFVVFEESPSSTSATSLCIPVEHNSSLEDIDFEDDDSNSSSDDSDVEDNNLTIEEELMHFDCFQSYTPVGDVCKWIAKCPVQTVPVKNTRGAKKKTVHFAEGSRLAVIRPMIAWGYAYRESRRGPWEEHARDRARFRCRIESLAPVLNAILDPQHRRKVVASRLSSEL